MIKVMWACDEKIIKEFFSRGYGYEDRMVFLSRILDNIEKNQDENKILELLMCIGIKIEPMHHNKNKGQEGPLTWLEHKIHCCHMLQHKLYDPEDQSHSIKNLRKSLMGTMDDLMAWPDNKDQRISEIDDSLNHRIPVPCIDLIYGYQTNQFVRYIDWSKD